MSHEAALWKWLRNGSKHLSKHLHICRVENSIMKGYPDVEGCYSGMNFHIELKSSPLPKRKSTLITIDISDEQIRWLNKRWRIGGSCFVLLRVGTHRNITRYLIPGNLKGKKWSIEELGYYKVSDAEEVILNCWRET